MAEEKTGMLSGFKEFVMRGNLLHRFRRNIAKRRDEFCLTITESEKFLRGIHNGLGCRIATFTIDLLITCGRSRSRVFMRTANRARLARNKRFCESWRRRVVERLDRNALNGKGVVLHRLSLGDQPAKRDKFFALSEQVLGSFNLDSAFRFCNGKSFKRDLVALTWNKRFTDVVGSLGSRCALCLEVRLFLLELNKQF
jgi:hypothetical protein